MVCAAKILRHADLVSGLALFALTLIAAWTLLRGGIPVGMDSITQFYPWYSFLGESLRSGNIPAWNPHQFSGAPFAADPLSGWTYLPAMLLFTLLPLATAAVSYVILHLLLAGLGTYALARTLDMNVAGSLLAAVAYEYTSYLVVQNMCCFAYAGVVSWLPLMILGAELAARSPRWLGRGLWWGLGGLALSQILAAWPGQGSYYALIALGGYIIYRTLLFPPDNVRGLLGRFGGLLLHGGALLLFGFGLAAAGILPLVEYNTLSNLAGGYSSEGAATAYGGWTLEDWKRLLVPGTLYAGLTTLSLALAAPLVVRGRHAVPYFAVLSLGALTLSGRNPTLVHSALYHLLPGFERLHPHNPERVMLVFYLGVALLAGATLSALGQRGKSSRILVLLPVLAALFLVTRVETISPRTLTGAAKLDRWVTQIPFLLDNGINIPEAPLITLILALTLVTVYALLPAGRRVTVALLIAVVFVDLIFSAKYTITEHATHSGGDKIVRMDLPTYYVSTGAEKFLRSRTEKGPVRYVGYDYYARNGLTVPYSVRFADPDATALLINNAATPYGLQNVQGYNAVHLARYDEYLRTLNGRPQNRHDADIFPDGLDSPLLDLLNVRYIVVPAVARPNEGVLQKLREDLPTAYRDDQVHVLETRAALPRAWIVHSARREDPEKALKLLSSGKVDPRQTALLEQPPPKLARPDGSSGQASVTAYEADRIRLKAATGGPGLLMLSEVYYPAWKAYVDGRPVPLYRANYLLRAIPVPAGEHTVELRYESWYLRMGMAISLAAYATLGVMVGFAGTQLWRKASR